MAQNIDEMLCFVPKMPQKALIFLKFIEKEPILPYFMLKMPCFALI